MHCGCRGAEFEPKRQDASVRSERALVKREDCIATRPITQTRALRQSGLAEFDNEHSEPSRRREALYFVNQMGQMVSNDGGRDNLRRCVTPATRMMTCAMTLDAGVPVKALRRKYLRNSALQPRSIPSDDLAFPFAPLPPSPRVSLLFFLCPWLVPRFYRSTQTFSVSCTLGKSAFRASDCANALKLQNRFLHHRIFLRRFELSRTTKELSE